ncbi:NAD(P)/FAD-dependent oxidoreductase [Paenibacillus sacheonensis]|uniref:FAD-dependent oxidoreductase n=1 Tax=Paenibacillus sacheonensis TaxID=742054 RepID=A0A7X4YQN6_9BACL|nr:NAD(P)/FAD-dependent oxidoreductase [Paenibacillus sacheonensis]MBM7567897.1 phytoene dehydrogenase-like protein [Paenibacillus sacheonensis]NBC70781.1 FAD-dependent oxidoreductase [Paenibacillus sacheonensis]
MQKVDVVVVGGGIAGLTAAIYAAKAGKQTVVIEKQERLGGRAISNKKKRAYFNLGAHSLYKGDAYATFRELGLTLQGKQPSAFAYGVWKGKLSALPSDMKSLFTTPLLSWKGKMEFASCLMKLMKADTHPFDRISIREWVEGNLRDPMVRNIFYSLLRAASYVVGPDLPAAGPVLKQLQNALKGALYLDRGWGALVEELRTKAADLGVRLLTNTKVSSVDIRGGIVRQVLCEDGTKINTRHVILATPPAVANDLVPFAENTALRTWKEQAIEVNAACLDVALNRLPKPKQQFAYGIDQTVLFSNYSRAAYLSDDGAQVISLIKYQGKDTDADKDLHELEGVLDLMQPGWRDELIVKQYLPRMTVCHDFMHLKRLENPGPAVPEIQGLYVAGEWASHGEVLVDAATASAKRAVQHMLSLEDKERNAQYEHRGVI